MAFGILLAGGATGVNVKSFISSTLLLVVLLVVGIAPAFAQLAADPNDRLYTDLEIWMDRGLTSNLPSLRPYPVQVVKKVLADVAAKGTDADKKLAAWYLSKIDGTSNIHGVASTLGRASLGGIGRDWYAELGLQATLQGSLDPLLTYSAKIGGLLVGPGSTVLPEYQRSTTDYVDDVSNSAFAFGLTPKVAMLGGGAFGTDSMYLQAGVFRASYGPFWGDNVVLSPTAPQSGQISFVLNRPEVSISFLFMEVSPTDMNGNGGATYGKFVSLGSIEVSPFDWLTLGVFDTVVWGQRFEPLYLLPVVNFYTEGMAGYPDNAFIGLSGQVRFPQSVKADVVLYVDDMGTQWSHLDFNFMLLAALQAGVTWTPNLPYLTRLRVTNTLITPYTYSHQPYSTGDTLNYLNYTNQGQNMGPSLQPNSYRLEVEALVRPMDWLDVTGFGRFILHGNASSGFNIVNSPGDGSVFDNGIDSTGYTYAPIPARDGLTYTRFLSQSVLEKVIQAGFETKAYLDAPVGEIQLSFTYTLEVVLNGSVAGDGPVDGNNMFNHYIGIGASFTY